MSATTAREVEEFMSRAWMRALAERLCALLAGNCFDLNPEENA